MFTGKMVVAQIADFLPLLRQPIRPKLSRISIRFTFLCMAFAQWRSRD
jgi:hypothetical protein